MSRKPARPADGFAWEKPEHRFFDPGFPPGYTPRLAREAMMTSQQRKKSQDAEAGESHKGKY